MIKKWWQEPVRMMRRDFLGDFSYYINSDLAAMAREARDKWHVNCEWIMATPGCAPGKAHLVTFNSSSFEKLPGLGKFDIVRSYLPHAKRYGIRLLAYINLHWYSYAFANEHPEYVQQLIEDGTPYGIKYPLYGNGTTFCINCPNWRNFAFKMISEVTGLGVDGCFLDGPVMYPKSCYCEHCRSLFNREYGFDYLPSFGDWGDVAWKPFLKFRRESWGRFLKDAQCASLKINPDSVIFLNGGRYDVSGVVTARDISQMEKFQNFSGAEEFYHVSEDYCSPFNTLNLGRFLSAGDKPGVVFTDHAMGAWHYVPLTKSEMTAALTQTVASGSNTWFAIFMETMRYRSKEAFDANDIQKFFSENDSIYISTESAAETAVLMSTNTVYNYISARKELFTNVGSGKEQDLITDVGDGASFKNINARRAISETILDKELHGVYDVANFSHTPIKIFWDDHINTNKLKNISTLILPNSACLSDIQIKRIIEFVQQGGTLAAFFESGFYDENGNSVQREEWLNFLGIRSVDGAFKPSSCEDYILAYGEKLQGSEMGMLLMPRTYNALKVVPLKDAEPLAAFMNPVGLPYQKINGISKYSALICSNRGKGKVVYCAGTLFESFIKYHLDDHLQLFKSIIALLSKDQKLQIVTNAPGSMAVEVRKNNIYTVIHLLNTTSDMKRPSGSIVPLKNISISIRIRKKPKTIRAMVSNKTLEFTHANDFLEFRVPIINAYEVISVS